MTLAAVSGFAVKPSFLSVLWDRPAFYGHSKSTVTSITPGALYANKASGDAPLAVHASASDVAAVGTLLLSGEAISAYKHLEHRWTATYSDDSPIASDGEIVNPHTNIPVNMYTDQIGGEAAFIFHDPGSYKITRTAKSANGVVSVSTKTITVTKPPTHKWFDPDNGNDSNDGRDPHGFDLTSAVYTESTGELTEAGKFTSYDHAAATARTYLTDNSNWIALFYDTAWHWHRIASKVNGNTIVLLDKIGADKTGITSSTGALETFDPATDVDADTSHHMKVNKVYAMTSGILGEDVNGLRFMGWGGDGRFTFRATASFAAICNLSAGSFDKAGDRMDLHRAELDGGSSSGHQTGLFEGLLDGDQTANDVAITHDRCWLHNTYNPRSVTFTNDVVTSQHAAWGSIFDNRRLGNGAPDKQENFLIAQKFGSHSAYVGCQFYTEADDDVFNHHCYPTGDYHHRLRSFCSFPDNVIEAGGAEGSNICFNDTCKGGATATEYVTYYENRFSNSKFAISPSNVNNSYDKGAGNGVFKNVLVLSNSFDGDTMLGGCFWGSTEDAFVGYNVGWDLDRGIHENFVDNSDCHHVLVGNLAYNTQWTRIASGSNGTDCEGNYECAENVSHMTGTDDQVVIFHSGTNGNVYMVENQSHAPNDVDGDIYDDVGTVEMSLAALNAIANNSGNIESNPGWRDPANRDFRI